MNERRKKYELLLKLKTDFVKENEKKMKEKMERDKKERRDELDYRIDFFPFTYGE
jgi:hypothetical protein